MLTPGLVPESSLLSEVIPVVKDDGLDLRPCVRIAAADPAEIFVIVGQALAGGVVPVVPQRAQVAEATAAGFFFGNVFAAMAKECHESESV